MLACRADGDDAIWAWHLELEVGVVEDGYELGVAWSPQNHVVDPVEPDHVKSKDLPPEVVGSPKADGQIDLPERMGSVPWRHSKEWQCIIA